MLTDKEIKLIKQSWHKLDGIDPVLIGEVFYRKLFLDLPEVRKLFTTSREIQSQKLWDMLSLIVARLERMHELSNEIANLARRHVTYGVKEEYYKYVGTALIWMLNQALGDDWNDELQSAWENCYRELSATMIAATK
jgi:nitric oxide dioxygenase